MRREKEGEGFGSPFLPVSLPPLVSAAPLVAFFPRQKDTSPPSLRYPAGTGTDSSIPTWHTHSEASHV